MQILEEDKILKEWDYADKNKELMVSLMQTDFFKKCVFLCWSMTLQDPVMYLDKDINPGSKYDKNTYKEFVQSGDTVRYVVWPALFLHKDGPLLYKGVVQAYWEQEDRSATVS